MSWPPHSSGDVRADRGLSSPNGEFGYATLDREHSNIRAALRASIDAGRAKTALRIAGSLYRFWANRGHILEVEAWYAEILAMEGENQSAIRGHCLLGSGVIAYFRSNLEAAEAHTREAQAQYMALNDRLGVAWSYGNLGVIADVGGDQNAAVSLYYHALGMFRELGEKTSQGYMLGNWALA